MHCLGVNKDEANGCDCNQHDGTPKEHELSHIGTHSLRTFRFRLGRLAMLLLVVVLSTRVGQSILLLIGRVVFQVLGHTLALR